MRRKDVFIFAKDPTTECSRCTQLGLLSKTIAGAILWAEMFPITKCSCIGRSFARSYYRMNYRCGRKLFRIPFSGKRMLIEAEKIELNKILLSYS